MGLRQIERRYTPGDVSLSNAESRTVRGYAAKFGRLSQDLGGFVERIDPKFFNKSAGDGWVGVMARYNHSDDYLLGTTRAGTLRLGIDDDGLSYEIDMPSARADVYELIQRGDVGQSSFAFRVPSGGDEWGTTERGYPMRTLLTGQTVDVAPVNSPAYLDTSVGLSSLADFAGASIEEVRAAAQSKELNKFLPNGGRPVIIDLGQQQRVLKKEDLEPKSNPAPAVNYPEAEQPPRDRAGRDAVPDLTEDCGCSDEEYTKDSEQDSSATPEQERQHSHLSIVRRRLELEALRKI